MYVCICIHTYIHANTQVINFNCMMFTWIIAFLYGLLFKDAAALLVHSAFSTCKIRQERWTAGGGNKHCL